jgi:hypothetical protein
MHEHSAYEGLTHTRVLSAVEPLTMDCQVNCILQFYASLDYIQYFYFFVPVLGLVDVISLCAWQRLQ